MGVAYIHMYVCILAPTKNKKIIATIVVASEF